MGMHPTYHPVHPSCLHTDALSPDGHPWPLVLLARGPRSPAQAITPIRSVIWYNI